MAAGESRDIELALPVMDQRETFVNVSIRKKSRTTYSEANHELGIFQYQAKPNTAHPEIFENNNAIPLSVTENRLDWEIDLKKYGYE